MGKEKSVRLEFHLKFNGRNPRHLDAAQALATVGRQYKSSFIALTIEHYMKTHPMGVSLAELLEIYRQTERSYLPKSPITENLLNSRASALQTDSPSASEDVAQSSETSSAIDKAMDFYDIS